ncbi:hypothetical protein OsJ_27249 [Oryza sativa Japonica Group]|uniref:DUF4283 domain-containing protein n=1 Tax=Oryza sativa subsp. japonica TaxID=39947 RepID=B9G0U0_ORYSJ|nr:hypothetical protein OsJ_27249 [Oryza sativa Japonica Group]
MAREVLKVLEAGLAEIALELGILLEAGRGKVEEVGTSMVDGNQMLVPMAEKMAGLDRRILEILKVVLPVPLPFCQFPPVPAGGGGTSLLAAGSGLAQFGGVAAQLGGGMIAGGVAQGSTAAQHGVGLTGAGAQTSSDSGGNGSVLAGISPFGDNVHLPGGVGGDQHLTAVGETAGQRIKHDSKVALVKVTRGQMTVQNVVSGLERLIPGNWKWVVEENGDNTFRTIFTSTAELKRMVEWGTIHTKVGDAEMKIIERGVGNEVKYVLPKAVGSILGITKMVDMNFTRRYDIARLQVLVLDPSLIPDVVDVAIGDNLYELCFKVEQENGFDVPEPIGMDNSGDREEGKGTSFGPSTQVLPPVVKGSSVSDEEFDGLVEESAGAESVKSHESLAVKLAAVPDAILSPARQSKRRASDSDQLTLQRAEKIKAGRNLEV